MDSDFDIEAAPLTVRVAAPTIPPEALPSLVDDIDDEEPTLVIVPSALAALAERSALTTPAIHPAKTRSEEEDGMRVTVIGIWAVAAVLFVLLGLFVR